MREAKINELQRALLVEQHVLELQVAVCDGGEVAVGDAVEHLVEEVARDGLGHRGGAAVDDLVEELAAARQLHEDEVQVRVAALPDAVRLDADDVRMRELLEDVAGD